jgi:hypothetical protein
MKDPNRWVSNLTQYTEDRLTKVGLTKNSGFDYELKLYGYNAVTGSVPAAFVPNEIAVVLRVTAKTQELATKVAKVFNPLLLHFPVNRDEQLPSFAFPFSPTEIERGMVYEFRLNHVVHISDPLALTRIVYAQMKGGK